MLPDYIKWENVHKYQITSDIVEEGKRGREEQSGKIVQQLKFF